MTAFLLAGAVKRMVNKILSAAYQKWLAATVDTMQEGNSVRMTIVRMKMTQLSKAFNRWRDYRSLCALTQVLCVREYQAIDEMESFRLESALLHWLDITRLRKDGSKNGSSLRVNAFGLRHVTDHWTRKEVSILRMQLADTTEELEVARNELRQLRAVQAHTNRPQHSPGSPFNGDEPGSAENLRVEVAMLKEDNTRLKAQVQMIQTQITAGGAK